MGIGSSFKNEKVIDNEPLPISYTELVKKSICKIIINNKPSGTGFFMEIKSFKYLITCYHVISSDLLDNIINIENWEQKIFILKLNNNSTIFFEDLDITLIKINESNIENISFLNYDENIINGYEQYEKINVFTLGYPSGDELALGLVK